ncbi:chromatin remodeling complex subunit [Colletotrichum karsti]|uniref:Chromatin remodeling complex subunit n=1 Tax=Colletotrichum karsti TaxID=1095194 RepID=A0A9P6IGC0_9PEZI|nr:chromatin remodeling complex subunit [Colletotrichum karsti]KAF9881919.1 chromatin remodeling complex subunit [Colletotrichum karsti]
MMLAARTIQNHPAPNPSSGSTAGTSSNSSISEVSASKYNLRPRLHQSPTKGKLPTTTETTDSVCAPETPGAGKMSTQTGKFREDQVLIICPGSQTTMAQLGCGELTPPVHRLPTRMFKDEETDEWRPYHTFKRKKQGLNGALAIDGPRPDDDEYEWVEDTDSSEGAVYPLQGGRIANMEAFLAFLDHVHSMLTTTYHNTPIMLMASPQWTRPDNETIARYIFEKTRTPALCMIHSGIATQYGIKWPNVTVVDIGYEKVDVTCIHDGRVVSHSELGAPNPERFISGGEIFTRKLVEKLKSKDFTYDMAEQLKKSHICEVLPYAPTAKNLMELPTTSTVGAAPISAPAPEAPQASEPAVRAPAADDEPEEPKGDEGVLDVASIVTAGNARDFLAKKEKEKAEKGKGGRKGKAAQEAEAAKPVRLPNAKRTHNTFHFEEVIQEEVQPPKKEEPKPETKEEPKKEESGTVAESKDVEMTDSSKPVDAPTEGETKPTEPAATTDAAAPAGTSETNGTTGQPVVAPAEAPAATNGVPPVPERQAKRVRRDIEVGLERFTFADRAEIDRIVSTIYRTVQGIEDMYMRPQCWENIVFVGNGSRLRGLKDNIIQTLTARHLISPSTATMFTSELPSNIATPTGTGAQTPTGSFTGAPHQLPPNSSGVNPLLQAATTASAQQQGTPGPSGEANGTPGPHHFHSQTPTTIKQAALPTYLSEWNKNGFEEAMFLGAQVAARIAFCQHNLDMAGLEAQRLASLSRVDYNEIGPKGIRTHSLLK